MTTTLAPHPETLFDNGKPVTWFVDDQVAQGRWREEVIAPEVTGLSRPITVLRASRRSNLIVFKWHGDKDTFCPPSWFDLALGNGACGYGCRSCFLMLTFRAMRDPMRHVLYENYGAFEQATRNWLTSADRRPQHTLGIGIDRSDSLLYEGVANAGHVRRLAPLFASAKTNPHGCKMILLTKSANSHYLAEIAPTHRNNVVVTFSLNPEAVADLWEGKYPDTGERITPPIARRLEAALHAQALGYEVRARIDPILTPEGWQDLYAAFFAEIARMGINFRYFTLGTYREKNVALDFWREKWGLLPMEWEPTDLEQDGTHRHLPPSRRLEIYRAVRDLIRRELPQARVSLCKETHAVRKALMLCNADCNCLR